MMTGLFRRRSLGQLITCDIHCLDGTVFSAQLSKRATGQELLLFVFRHLKIQDASSLGLVFAGDNSQQEWLNPTKSIRKQLPGESPYQLFLQVRVYPLSPQSIKDVQTRYQLFLQVKKDLVEGRLRCSRQHLVDLLALFAQAELGDYSEDTFPSDYMERSGLLEPQGLHNKEQIVKAHREMKGMSFDECEIQVLELAECQENYGLTLYPVLDSDKSAINLGLGPTGVHVVMGAVPIAVYEWGSVLKIVQKYHTLSLKIRTPHTMAIHTAKFHCPSTTICKQLALLCHEMQGAYQSSTPYASTFRRIWSGRGSAVLKAPLQKLRSSIKRRPSSTDLSVERQLSRKLSFQGTADIATGPPRPILKRSISDNFSDRKLPVIEYSSPPDPVVPTYRRYQETGQPIASSSPYSTPKQSVVVDEDVRTAVSSLKNPKKSKAISDSSLNNILDSTGKSVRNLPDKSLADLSDTSDQLSIVTTDSQLGTPQAFRPPTQSKGDYNTVSTTSVPSVNIEETSTSVPAMDTEDTSTTQQPPTLNRSRKPTSVPTIVVKAMSEQVPELRPTSGQSEVGLFHFHDSSDPCTPEPVILRDKSERSSSRNRRHSLLWDTEDNMEKTPFLDSHIASMYFETSQHDELTCDL